MSSLVTVGLKPRLSEMNELRVVEGWDNFDQLSMMQQDCAISG
jgi:hypothetical protein